MIWNEILCLGDSITFGARDPYKRSYPNELGQILIAEIYDHILFDFANAKIYYLSILQNFPTSIHYEQIRLRLNEIMSAPS